MDRKPANSSEMKPRNRKEKSNKRGSEDCGGKKPGNFQQFKESHWERRPYKKRLSGKCHQKRPEKLSGQIPDKMS